MYKRNRNAIICGDCVEVMNKFPDGKIDLVVTSPPYGNFRDYKGYSFNFEAIANQLFRVVKDGGVVVWITGDATMGGSETGTSFEQILYFKSIGFRLHDTMIYVKTGIAFPSTQAHARYHQVFEYMFVLSKGKPKVFCPICDRDVDRTIDYTKKTKRDVDGRVKNMHTKNMDKQIWGKRYNLWQYSAGINVSSKDKISFNHPATFPERLAEDHILSWSNEGDIVLDPMCGSGTTCKMAMLNKRKFIGIDIAREYCNIAKERILKYEKI